MPRTAAQVLLAILAMGWALPPYDYVDTLGITVIDVCQLLLALTLLYAVFANRELRLPFHILWPIVAVGALVAGCTYLDALEAPSRTAAAVALFAATVHFADTPTVARRLLTLAALGGSVIASLVLFGKVFAPFPFPTVYAPDVTGLSVGLTYGHAAAILVVTPVACVALATHRAVNVPWRIALAIAALVSASALALSVSGLVGGIAAQASSDRAPLAAVALHLAVLWLGARVAAKLIVQRRDENDGWPARYFVLGALLYGLELVGGETTLVLLPLVGGLACASTVSERDDAALPWLAYVPAPALLVLILANLTVAPANNADPRNYAAVLANNIDNPDPALWREITRRHANEREVYYWQARLALERGAPLACAEAFHRAATLPPSHGVLPPPSTQLLEDLLIRLRDYVQTLESGPEQFAYERALLSMGETDSAGYLLSERFKSRGGEPAPDAWRQLAAELLREGTSPALFDDWDRDALLRYFAAWGVERPTTPNVRWLLAEWRGDSLRIRRNGEHTGYDGIRTARAHFDIRGEHPLRWIPRREDSSGVERWDLVEQDDEGRPLATLATVNDSANVDYTLENAVNPGWRPVVAFIAP